MPLVLKGPPVTEPLRPGDSNGIGAFALGILLGGASGLPGTMGGSDGLPGSVLGAHDVATRLVGGEENSELKPCLA